MKSPSQPEPTGIGRRDFLKTAAGGAVVVPLALGAVAHAAGGDTIKVALIGCGSRGTGAAVQALATKGPVTLWAMADAFPDRIERSLNELTKGSPGQENSASSERIDVPPERRFSGLDAYRKAIDSGVDVVLLTSPPAFRPAHFAYAVNAGKHVFMEKPVATDAPGVRQVLATAEEAKRKNLKVAVGLQRHHDRSYLDSVPRVQDGAVGDIIYMRCYWDTAASAKVPPPREGLTELEYQVRNWYYFQWLSGDHIVEQHVHNLDVCNWVKGAHPVEAQGKGGRQVRTGKQYGDIFDHHVVEYTYADGTKLFSQCRQIPGCWNHIAEYVHGTKGVADVGRAIKVGGKDVWRQARRRRGEPVANAYQIEHDVFFAAIRNNTPHNETEHGAMATMTAILGCMATHSGQVIRWEDAFQSKRRLTTDAEVWTAAAPVHAREDGFYPVAAPGITKVI